MVYEDVRDIQILDTIFADEYVLRTYVMPYFGGKNHLMGVCSLIACICTSSTFHMSNQMTNPSYELGGIQKRVISFQRNAGKKLTQGVKQLYLHYVPIPNLPFIVIVVVLGTYCRLCECVCAHITYYAYMIE